MTGERLSVLIERGLSNAHVVFPERSETVVGALLADRAGGFFTPDATAPAVAAVMTNDADTLAVLFGALRSGATLVSLPLLGRGADLGAYVASVRAACASSGATEIIARDDVAELLESVGLCTRAHRALHEAPLAQSGTEFRLVQHSSGSTGAPKSIGLSDTSLGRNVESIITAIEPTPGEAAVSWLPLSHDMGLIGMVLTAVASCAADHAGPTDIVVLDPATFLRDPGAWIAALDKWSGTITAAPDFGFRLAATRTRGDSWNLAPLRCVISGGEIVRSDTLHSFIDRFVNCGLAPRALCPAYGMAEIGVAATMTPIASDLRTRAVSAARLAYNEIADPVDDVLHLVASGVPLHGYDVVCEPTSSSLLGTIRLVAPSIGVDAQTDVPLGDEHGFTTGDIGFVDDGWLYVCGRFDDYLVVNGRNVFAPHVEGIVGTTSGVRSGRAVAVSLPTGDWVLLVEPAADILNMSERKQLTSRVRRAATAACGARPSDVVVLDRGALPLTPSGKLRRAAAREMYVTMTTAGGFDRRPASPDPLSRKS